MQFSKYKHGGDEEDRTPDPLRARQVLSQLSYTPIFIFTTIYIFNIYRRMSIGFLIFIKNPQN